MSARQYQELMEARTARTRRTEAQLISSALFDGTPTLQVDKGSLSPAWLSKRQTVFRNAIVICGCAHLRIVKAFDKKVIDLCTQALHPETGLRTVNTAELLNADRKIWSEIIAFTADKWTLDEAMHELTKVRSDVHALLQPRPRPTIVYKGPKGKGKGNKGKPNALLRTDHLKDDREAAMLTEATKNLSLKHGNKTLCLRFNRGTCPNKQSKFAHLCAIKLPNGNACGMKHAARQHRFKVQEARTDTAPNEPARALPAEKEGIALY